MSNVTYQTKWSKDGKKGMYETKRLTDYHRRLHEWSDYAMTCEVDHDCQTPFGSFSEVIAQTNHKKPQHNKAFPS